MRLSRGKLLLLVSAVSMMLAVGALLLAMQYDLPDPAYANRQELFYWLVCKDMSKQSRQTRLVLANRLEEECRNGLDWRKVDVKLNQAQQNLVWNNLPLLLRPWFVEKARYYGILTAEKRQDYLDGLIDIIASWQGIETLLPHRAQVQPGEKTSTGLTNYLWNAIDRIEQEAAPSDRRQIGELWNALKARWLLRILSS